ncbi:MAG: hypothetical protein BWX80_00385 [Candidatus Hydrogenedentes bacterium ADurb.Bin101]|nr:MAG: hypothetical protein BWX80_00385 [Candidatus Hydrogenedentes bacterium ADurb.Bin101]
MPISVTRCRTFSFALPAAPSPATSPFTSAINTGTPIREKPSASTMSETVLPVPVAPATNPWRLPYRASRETGCSPFPTSILSTHGLLSRARNRLTSTLKYFIPHSLNPRKNREASNPGKRKRRYFNLRVLAAIIRYCLSLCNRRTKDAFTLNQDARESSGGHGPTSSPCATSQANARYSGPPVKRGLRDTRPRVYPILRDIISTS